MNFSFHKNRVGTVALLLLFPYMDLLRIVIPKKMKAFSVILKPS